MPSESLEARLAAALQRRGLNGNLRSLDPPGYDASGLVDFSSNDYLALSKANKLREAFQEALEKSQNAPYGPASSRLLDGNSPEHLKLEKRLASFFHGQSGLLFNSGFDANAGVFACLPAENDIVLYDELIHASAHDGMRASRCKTRLPFKHNSPGDLRRIIHQVLASDRGQALRSGSVQLFVAVESLYSMDGDLAPLVSFVDTIEELLPKGNGHLIVDEAHSTGLYGHQGRGLVCALGLEDRVLVRLHTFGKALACSGGVILCSPTLRNYFINYARPLIYSTVMPHLMVTAIDCAIAYLDAGGADQAIRNLHTVAAYCQDLLETTLKGSLHAMYCKDEHRESSEAVIPTTTPIIPILTDKPRALSTYLIQQGYLVRPIGHPTVPKGQERVRLCLHANNTKQEVHGLVKAVAKWASLQDRNASSMIVSKL